MHTAYFALNNIGSNTHPLATTIPNNVFMLFQCFFACITPSLAFGSVAERAKLSVFFVFLFIWSTCVYNVIAYWVWAPNGWLRVLGALDFAGGSPVHICSGVSAMAYALAVGPRRSVRDFKSLKSSNISDVYLGTVLLWFGWFGFNGGSEFAINARSVNACIVTNVAASIGGLTWMFTEMFVHETNKMSLNSFCSGAIAGLVAITPGSGYVTPVYSIIFGLAAGIICYFSTWIKILFNYNYDDACDAFAVHGVGGIVGNLLTGLFASNYIVTLAGDTALNDGAGWVDGHVK